MTAAPFFAHYTAGRVSDICVHENNSMTLKQKPRGDRTRGSRSVTTDRQTASQCSSALRPSYIIQNLSRKCAL